MLSVVPEKPHSVASAVRRLGLARQSVQPVANDLVGAGALRREADPTDPRGVVVDLVTKRGAEAYGRKAGSGPSGRSAEGDTAGADETSNDAPQCELDHADGQPRGHGTDRD